MIRFLFQFVLWTLFFYLFFRVLRMLVGGRQAPKQQPPPTPSQVDARHAPLDLSNADVEDAKFHDVKK